MVEWLHVIDSIVASFGSFLAETPRKKNLPNAGAKEFC